VGAAHGGRGGGEFGCDVRVVRERGS
jgi:hypothetical protein